jgi:hypothetical protein
MEGSQIKGALKKVLVSPENGWDGWVMRVITLEPEVLHPGIPPWPHVNFIAEGQAVCI